MLTEIVTALVSSIATGTVGYLLGGRNAGEKAAHEQKLRSASNLSNLIGGAITKMRSEAAKGHGDDLEGGDNEPFEHLDFLSQLWAVYDIERPFLPTKASTAVNDLIGGLRRHAANVLHVAAKELTPQEYSESKGIESLIEHCTSVQDELVKIR